MFASGSMGATKGRPTRLILNGLDAKDNDDTTSDHLDTHTHEGGIKSSQQRPVSHSTSSRYDVNGGSEGAKSKTSDSGQDAVLIEQAKENAKIPQATPSSTIPTSLSHFEGLNVPTRTSSHKAVANADKSSSPPQVKRSPKRHRNIGSISEEQRHRISGTEKEWMSTNHKRSSSNHTSMSQATAATTMLSTGPEHSTQAAKSPLNVYEPYGGISGDLIDGLAQGWTTEKENILKGPFEYLESHPGKDIRSQMIIAFNEWLQVPASSLNIITGIVTMLHTASLLIDDVEDNSQLRRGVPVAHAIFGTAQTINSANYMYFNALQEVLKLDNPEAIKIYTEELLNLHRGQGMDLFWRDTLTCPSEDDYLEMVGNKTGGLFRLAIKLMCAESPRDDFASIAATYVPLVNTVGLLFQILDDYRNLSDNTYTANKGLCEDLTEGKFSFPIIHAIRTAPANLVLINILKQKTTDDEVKRYAVAYMDRCGSFSYTRRVLRGLTKKALQLVEEVDAGRGKADGVKNILQKLRVDRQARDDMTS